MQQVLVHNDCIFNQIFEFNKLPHLFPFDVKATKLNPDITDNIFKEFSFKFINKKSASTKIFKEIYNTFFGKEIIKTNIDENKNAHHSVHNCFSLLYEFCKEYLILKKETKLNLNNNKTQEGVVIEV